MDTGGLLVSIEPGDEDAFEFTGGGSTPDVAAPVEPTLSPLELMHWLYARPTED